MLHLMKKNSSFILQLVLLLPILTLAWFIKRRPLDTYQIFMGGIWLMLTVLGGAINGEMIEEKSKGYRFLRILPIKDRYIVQAKFLMAFLTASVLVGYIFILFSFLSGPAFLFPLGRIFILMFAGLTLLLVALLYNFAYRLGFSRFIKIAWTTFFVFILAPILILEFVFLKTDVDYAPILNSIVSLPAWIWGLVVLAYLAGYYGLMTLAVRAKEARKG